MKALLVMLGGLLAAASAVVFFSGRDAHRRQVAARIPAKQAAAMLAEAWSDHHTRA